MVPKIAVLADYANVAQGHKLNIMGIFTTIHAAKVPVVHTQMVVVAQFECDLNDAGEKTAKTVLVDADGHEIFRLSGQVVIPRDAEGYPTLFNQLLALNNLELPSFGSYAFQLFFDDEFATEIALRVAPTGGAGQVR